MAVPPRFARNLGAVLLWELLWGFGAACTASAIFVPFLSQFAGSKRLVGTVGLTMLLEIPALFVSLWLAHRLRRRRLAVALLWASQVVGWIALGAVLLADAARPTTIVPVIYASQAILAFLGGVSMAPTYQLLTGVFGERFGTAQGIQLLVRQVSGVAGGIWAASALEQRPFPKNFGLTFFVAGLLLTFSNIALLFFTKETEPEDKGKPPSAFWPALVRTAKGARPLASFFWVIAGVAWAIGVQGFLVVSALERLKLGDRYAGVFSSVTLATVGIGGAIAGRLGDRFGHARVLFGALGIQALAFALSMGLFGIAHFYVVLALVGASGAALHIGLAGLTARLAPKEEKGAFIAIMRWVLQLVLALATVVLAFVADRAGYVVLFGSSILPLGVGMILARRIAQREPRAADRAARDERR
jgi:hypothetical protein